ncbi:MAG: RpiB/LacA/LacB family sugar-phosphate isomerase [Sciscionella sp.]
MRIAITADHNALALKAQLCDWLRDNGHLVDDRGIHRDAGTVDYPRLCADVAAQVLHNSAEHGVVLGGSGSGEAIACNKQAGIRAALCERVFTAEIARGHNDANVLVMGAKVVAPSLAERILATWLSTPFKGGRHQVRLDQIAALERGESLP